MLERLTSHWWLLVLRGIVALALAIVAIAVPGVTITALVILFGAYAAVDGAIAIVAAVRMSHDHGRWTPLAVEGVAGLVAGAVIFAWPAITALVLAYLIGGWAVISGVLGIVSAVSVRRHVAGELLWMLASVVSLIFGVLVFAAPAIGLLYLTWMVAIYACIAGIALIALGLRLRRIREAVRA